MLKYILVRLAWIFITIYIILTMLFILYRLAPQEQPVGTEEVVLGYYVGEVKAGRYEEYIEKDVTKKDEIKASCSKCYVKDEGEQIRVFQPVPISEQYFIWLKGVITKWDWGKSTRISLGTPSFEVFYKRIPVSLKINIISLLIFMPAGLILGTIAALRKNKMADHIITIFVMFFISIPLFVTASVALSIFAYDLNWFPTQYAPKDADFIQQMLSLAIPVFGLSIGYIAGLTRLTRAELSEVLTSEFLLLARTKGLKRHQAVIRHAFRNSFVPLVPTIIFSFVSLLTGSVVMERIYGIPGVGSIFIKALSEKDYNVLLATSAFYTVISLVAILVVDLSYGLVDPRIRIGGKK